jgi:hypothetical protein
VAAWLSETVLRGRGPGASGFESHRRGSIFSKEETSSMDVCVCLAGADGRVVGGRATLFRHHREVSRVRIRPPMDVVLCAFRVVQKKES